MRIGILLASLLLLGAGRPDAQALYDLGAEQYRDGAYYKAAVTLEKALSLSGKDEALKGRTLHLLSYTFNATGETQRSAQNLYEAYGAFTRAGLAPEARKVLLEYGQAFYNLQEYDKAETVFRQALSLAHEAGDTLIQVHALRSYARMLLEKEGPRQKDAQAAVEMFGRVADDLHYPLQSEDMGALAYAYSLLGRGGESRYWLHLAQQKAETPAQQNDYHFRAYQVYSRDGRTAEALAELEKVTEYDNRPDADALRSAVSLAREDYLRDQAAIGAERLRIARLGKIALVLLFVAILGSLVLYFMARKMAAQKALAQEKAAAERYMLLAEELQARLGASAGATSGGDRLLERLCEQYYIYEGSSDEKLQRGILREVRSTIERLRSDSKTLSSLEKALDARTGGLAARLKEQLPRLKEEDVKLYILAASGLSSTAIATLMDKEKSVIYNRLSRLRARIADSDAPDKDRFLEELR